MQPSEAAPPGIQRTWLVEVAFGMLGAWGLERWLHWRLEGLDLLAVVVALAGARFGFWLGAGAGLAAGLLRLSAAGLAPGDMLAVNIDRSPLPGVFVFLALGAAIGLVGDGHRRALAREREARVLLASRHAELLEHHGVLVAAKEALDRRIIGQTESLTSMYEAAKELEVLDPEAILPATARLASRFLEAERLSIYRLEGFRLYLQTSIGDWPDRPGVRVVDDGPIGTVVRTGLSASVLTKADYDRSQVLLAAPITRSDGLVRGVIAVESVPFANLTPSIARSLDLIADWSSRALAKSEAYTHSQGQHIINPETGLHRVGYMLERLNQEWAIAKRYALPLSVMLVRLPAILDVPRAERAEAALPLVRMLAEQGRDVDLVGHYRTDDSFMLLLPITDEAGAAVLAERIRQGLPNLVVEVASNTAAVPTPEALLQVLQVMAFDLQDA